MIDKTATFVAVYLCEYTIYHSVALSQKNGAFYAVSNWISTFFKHIFYLID
jgi:hypothetical protein